MLPTGKGTPSHSSKPHSRTSEHNASHGHRPPPKMQRFTRPEDLADLEDMGISGINATANTQSTPGTSTNTSTDVSTGMSTGKNAASLPSGGLIYHTEQEQERARRYNDYIEAHTSFLNSANTEGSGYIPDRATTSHFFHSYSNGQNVDEDSIPPSMSNSQLSFSRTPTYYPASLTEDDGGFTAPGTPNSFLSSPSLGYYSHPSRSSSRTGFWVDQGASSLNLIMPSSAMFTKSREPTVEGDRLGFVKLMVTGKSRVWHSRLIQEMFQWEGIIANDFEDEFLQEQRSLPPSSETVVAADLHAMEDRQGNDPTFNFHVTQGSGSSQLSGQQSDGSRERKREPYHGMTEAIVERFASTMVLPAWARTGLDEQEMQQEILVKNICFVDTPGYSSFNNPNRAMDLVISYLGLQFQTTNEYFSKSAASDDSLGRFLANNTTGAHGHVDACLYVIEGQLTDLDIVFMQRLQVWVNLVPVLVPMSAPVQDSDSSVEVPPAMDIATARLDLIRQLRENGIEIYGIEEGEARAALSAPRFSLDAPTEDEISTHPLSLDASPLQTEFVSPPFIFHVPEDAVEAVAAVRMDVDVQQLNVTGHGEDSRGETLASHDSSTATSSSSSVDQPQADLGPLRQWVYVSNLAVLRHHTTLKFLKWRRHLPTMTLSPMYSSQESGSSRYRQHSSNGNDHSGNQLIYPYASDYLPGSSSRANLSTGTYSSPSSISGPLQLSQPLPTDVMDDLLAQDHRRISAKVNRMLETHSQVFERIMLERQAAWQKALEGMEREQRIEFLVQELKRWASEALAGMWLGWDLREACPWERNRRSEMHWATPYRLRIHAMGDQGATIDLIIGNITPGRLAAVKITLELRLLDYGLQTTKTCRMGLKEKKIRLAWDYG
ncbi:hypothetical protein BGZ54_001987 [Gamsiella multidivaricata]|nr:hypothetical protein BGZ54_001987 [Gamsiella multidivaricata]